MVHTDTLVFLLRRENKTSTVITARRMDTIFNNVTEITEKQILKLLQDNYHTIEEYYRKKNQEK